MNKKELKEYHRLLDLLETIGRHKRLNKKTRDALRNRLMPVLYTMSRIGCKGKNGYDIREAQTIKYLRTIVSLQVWVVANITSDRIEGRLLRAVIWRYDTWKQRFLELVVRDLTTQWRKWGVETQ